MAKGKNKPKLTNKQIENHLNQLYFFDERIYKLFLMYIEMNDDMDNFTKFIEKKTKEEEKNSK